MGRIFYTRRKLDGYHPNVSFAEFCVDSKCAAKVCRAEVLALANSYAEATLMLEH